MDEARELGGRGRAHELADLVETLRRSGFEVGVDQCLAAERIAALTQRLTEAGEPAPLSAWLAPVLCTSAEEQERFHEIFRRWSGAAGPVPGRPAPYEGTGASAEVKPPSVWVARWPWFALAVAGVCLLAAAIWFREYLIPVPPPEKPIAEVPTRGLPAKPPSTEPEREEPGREPLPSPAESTPAPEAPLVPPVAMVRGQVMDQLGAPLAGVQVTRTPSIRSIPAMPEGMEAAAVQLSPDGRHVLSRTGSGRAWLSEVRADGPVGGFLEDLTEPFAARFSTDGRHLTTIRDRTSVRLWDVETRQMLRGLTHDSAAIVDADFSPDGKRLAKVLDGGKAGIWDAETGQPLVGITSSEPIDLVRFSPDGGRLLTVNRAKKVELWNETGNPTGTSIQAGDEPQVLFSPDGRRIMVSLPEPGTFRVLDGRTLAPIGEPLRVDSASELGTEESRSQLVYPLAFASKAPLLVAGSPDGIVHFWNPVDAGVAHEPLRVGRAIESIAVSSDGRSLAYTSPEGPMEARVAVQLSAPGLASAVFSLDGTRVVTASADGTAQVWDARTGSRIESLAEQEGPMTSAVYSPDGSRIATVAADGSVRVWEPARGSLLRLNEDGDEAAAVAFSPDGTRVATASSNDKVRIWNAADGALIEEHGGGEGRPTLVAFNPDGTLVLARYQDRTVFAAAPGRSGESSGASEESAGRSRVFTPDGARVVFPGKGDTAVVLEGGGFKTLLSLEGHTDRVTAAEFSRDGERIVTASEDGTARLWSASTGAQIGAPLPHDAPVTHAAFSPDGTRVLTRSADGSVQIFDLSGLLAHVVDLETRRPVGEPVPGAGEIAFDADSNVLVAAAPSGIRIAHLPTETNAHGRFALPAEPDAAPVALEIRHGIHRVEAKLTSLDDTLLVTLPSALLSSLPAVRVGLGVMPLALLAAWAGWRLARRKLVLERRMSRREGETFRLALEAREARLFRGRGFRRALADLRRHREVESRDLDVGATVEAAARVGGVAPPQFARRKLLPEYLVLIDRATWSDQQARWVQELLACLSAEGPVVRAYAFDGDPTLCEPLGSRAPFEHFDELAARLADHRLLVFSDGVRMVDPLSGDFGKWVECLPAFTERALFTPVNAGEWGHLESALAEAGLPVLPATEAGLAAFVTLLDGTGTPRLPAATLLPALPSILMDRPWRWLDRVPPPDDEQETLVSDLRRYLGLDGLRWLAGCAVYPTLEWHVTLHLGRRLTDEAGRPLLDEATLLRLVRLPWFRHGLMPDWLRVRLAAGLSAADQALVREAFHDLLLTPLVHAESPFVLEVMRGTRPADRRRWLAFLRERLRSSTVEERLHDAVFLDFLAGRRLGPLQLRVPGRLRQLLYEHGLRAFGFRPAVLAGAAAVAALGGYGAASVAAGWIDAPLASLPPATHSVGPWSGHQLAAVRAPQPVDALASAGRSVWVSLPGESLRLWDPEKGIQSVDFKYYDPPSSDPAALAGDAKLLLFASEEGILRSFRHDDGTFTTSNGDFELNLGFVPTSLSFAHWGKSPSGDGVVLVASGSRIRRAWRVDCLVAGNSISGFCEEPEPIVQADGEPKAAPALVAADGRVVLPGSPSRVHDPELTGDVRIEPPFDGVAAIAAADGAALIGQGEVRDIGFEPARMSAGVAAIAEPGEIEEVVVYDARPLDEAARSLLLMDRIVGSPLGERTIGAGEVALLWSGPLISEASEGEVAPPQRMLGVLSVTGPQGVIPIERVRHLAWLGDDRLVTAEEGGILRLWQLSGSRCGDIAGTEGDPEAAQTCFRDELTHALASLGANALALEPRIGGAVARIVSGEAPRVRESIRASFEQLVPDLPAIDLALARAGLPAVLRYLPVAFDGWQPGSTGGGVWHLSEARARELGLEVGPERDERMDAAAATAAVAAALQRLEQELPGEDLVLPILVLAYGEPARAALDRAMASSSPSCLDCFLPLVEQALLPDEPYQRVVQFLAAALLADPRGIGDSLEPEAWSNPYLPSAELPGWGEPFGGSASPEMVQVPAGAFFMGCNEAVDTECYDDEKPGREVELPAYAIDRTEVTVAAFARCVEAGACSADGLQEAFWNGERWPDRDWACNWGKPGREQHPINCVAWSQAEAYCRWVGKRLPTEAEWEKAARGTDGRKYPWGNEDYGDERVANIADETAKREQPDWTIAKGYDDGFYGTAPVGSFPAGRSPYGAEDMMGNVWEWTSDWYTENEARSVRGGSWVSGPGYARASYRTRYVPDERFVLVGFRCAQ